MARPSPKRQPDRHNLLEDLLVNGLCGARSVDPEEGLHFYISAPPKAEGICLLFALDWGGKSPLFPGEEKKADYLSLFVPPSRGDWLATLIELKAAQESHQREAIDQITNSMRLLKKELEAREVLHTIRWQAIILHGYGGEFPRKKALGAGIPILSLSTHHKADLLSFVTRPFSTGREEAPKVGGRNSAKAEDLHPIERILMLGARESPPPPARTGFVLNANREREKLALTVEGGRVRLEGTASILAARDALCGADAPRRA